MFLGVKVCGEQSHESGAGVTLLARGSPDWQRETSGSQPGQRASGIDTSPDDTPRGCGTLSVEYTGADVDGMASPLAYISQVRLRVLIGNVSLFE